MSVIYFFIRNKIGKCCVLVVTILYLYDYIILILIDMCACKPAGQQFMDRGKTKWWTEIVEKQNGTCTSVILNNIKIYL